MTRRPPGSTDTGILFPYTTPVRTKRTKCVSSVPNANQCAGCHTLDHRTRAVEPIGLQARHLNRTFPGAGGEINQLERLVALGYLTGVPTVGIPRDADWSATAAPLDARARAYQIGRAHVCTPVNHAHLVCPLL